MNDESRLHSRPSAPELNSGVPPVRSSSALVHEPSLPIARVAFAVAGLGLLGCGTIEGNGQPAEDLREIPAVQEVAVCCGFHATLTEDANADPQVLIKTDKNLVDEVNLLVQNESLTIGWKNGLKIYRPSQPVEVEIVVPSLTHFEGSGGMELVCGDLVSEGLEVELSGASQGKFGELDLQELDIAISGGSHFQAQMLTLDTLQLAASGGSVFKAEGMTQRLDASLSGGSHLNGADLFVEDAELALSGGSEASLTVSGTLSGAASGASQVLISGDGDVSMDLSGGSSVERVDP